ncbi:MAG: TPR-domain containing protein [Acidobacteria bacterium]|jgi:tetratricopeptide (TPR) repeat protein|nr:TPR-domain containing protein [Acidobacteriota bacterium]
MSFSRLSLFVFIITTVLIGTNCSYYNRIVGRKNLVDGANAYKGRKFAEAERLFREAVALDPEGATTEGKAAQLFLARTIHSAYIGNRRETDRAEEAIREYQKVLQNDPKDQSSFKAVANLYENLGKDDEWLKWVTDRANNEQVPPDQRAEAFTSLAAKKNTCANDISDTDATKKTVTEDGKQVFKFVKPENPADFDKLKQCATEGLQLSSKAVELDSNSDSAWSYQTSLLIQNMRVAEMEGDTARAEQFKVQSDQAKEKFTALSEIKRQKEQEEAERKKAAEEAAAAAANKKK